MTMSKFNISVPEGLSIEDLHLTRDPVTGATEFNWAPLEAICRESGLDIALFRDMPEDNVAGLLMTWYRAHRDAGGAHDPVFEQLIAEAEAEDTFGEHRIQRGSHKPQ